MSAKLAEILPENLSSRPVATIHEAATCAEALKRMKAGGIHHLVVTRGLLVAGLLSDRVIRERMVSPLQTVDEVMAGSFPLLYEDATVYDALTGMVGAGVSALPILNKGRLVGIVTESDLLRLIHATVVESDETLELTREGRAFAAHPLSQRVLELLGDIGL